MTTDPAVIDIDEMPRAGIASWLERRLQARGPQDRDVGDLVNWPDRHDVDEILARTGMLHGVERAAVSALTKQLQPVDFPRGHTVFAEGEPGDRLYIAISGKVKIGRRSPDGHENLTSAIPKRPSDVEAWVAGT